MTKKFLVLGGLVASSALLSACTFGKPATTPATDTQMKSETQTMPTSSPMMQQQASPSSDTSMGKSTSAEMVVNMEAGSFYYKPNTITAKKGQKIKVVLSGKDMMHNFNIDELKVKSPLVMAGKTTTVEFTADKVGTFEFYCSVGNHRAQGQVGTLVVTE